MIYYFGLNFFSVVANSNVSFIAYHEDFRKFNLISSIATQAMHEQLIILFYLELLSCYCYYCKHDVPKNIFAKIIHFFIPNKKICYFFYFNKNNSYTVLTI